MSRPLDVFDLEAMLREVLVRHKDFPSTGPTMTVRVDGFYEPDEEDVDDTPLAVGDSVRLSYARLRIMEWDGQRPYLSGVVQSIEPWHDDLAGTVFVRFRNGAGAWYERETLKKVDADDARK